MRGRAAELLGKVGLDERVLDLRPSELSGGMQKRVALARAIAPDPEILFFDEPTTGLDPIRADVINRLITSLVEDLGTTAVTITHDMSSARVIAHAWPCCTPAIWSGRGRPRRWTRPGACSSSNSCRAVRRGRSAESGGG
jgi:ABC-type transporter Mla maintaining outer membrane lipid asymmetry ATPase subunit MlaF